MNHPSPVPGFWSNPYSGSIRRRAIQERSSLRGLHNKHSPNSADSINFKTLLTCALLGALPSLAQSEVVVKILHLQTNPKIIAIWKDAGATYEKAHPGVKIEFNYLENEAFKAKLPTLLQSKDRPSAFHSWGGGVMYEQVGSDICQDITGAAGEGGFKDTFYPSTVENFTVEGKMYGLPNDLGPIVFWYNRSCAIRQELIPLKSSIGRISWMRSRSAKRRESHRSPSEARTSGPCLSTPRFS